MRILNTLLGAIEKVNESLGKVLWIGILLTFIIIFFETICRYFFNSPNVWTSEIAQYVFATYALLCGGHLLRTQGHVNVDIVYSKFSPRGKAIARIATFPIFFLFTGAMLLFGTSFALDSLLKLEHSQSAWNPPLYPVKMLVPIGAFLIFFQGIIDLIRGIKQLRSVENDDTPDDLEKKG